MQYKNIFLLIFVSILLFSCEKEDKSLIGKDILPDSDVLGTDYFQFNNIKASTVMGEKVESQNKISVMLGSINNGDEYGHSKADFITQTRLSVLVDANFTGFGDNPMVDSVKMFMLYYNDKYYGDTLTDLNIKIYEINDDIYLDSTYYSNFDASLIYDEGSPICNQLVSPAPSSNLLELNIDNDYGQRIVDADTSLLKDNDVFLETFKGLYITTDSVTSGGSILYFSLISSSTYIKIYYHNDIDTLDYDLLMNTSCAEISMFKNSGYNNIDFNDSTSEFIYTQTMAGIKGKIDLSVVKTFADSGTVTINKAELVFDYQSQTNPEPEKLYLQVVDGEDNTKPSDYNLGYYNGKYNSSDNTYSFVITKHISDIITGVQQFPELYVYPSNSALTANRATLINNFDNKNIKLKIIYTKY